MQIGNFLQYDNVDALGNTLTYSDPCKFNAKFKGSNCFYSDTTKNYISLGPRTQFEDVTAIECTIMFTSISFTQTTYFCSNILNHGMGFCHYWTQRNMFGVFAGASGERWLWTTPFNIEANVPYKLRLEYKNSDYIFTINGQSCYVEKGTEVIVDIDDVTRIGTRDPNNTYGLRNGMMWDFRMYNSSGDLVHHYPMSEGMGKIIYDTVGGKHGTIVNAGNLYTVVWSKTQDYYHYNLTNGYISIDGDDCNRFTNTLKIPLKDPDNVLIVKDSFNSGILNYTIWGAGVSSVPTIQTSNDGNYIKWSFENAPCPTNIPGTAGPIINYQILTEFQGNRYNSSISSPNLSPNVNYWANKNPAKSTTYKLKFKCRVNRLEKSGVSLDKIRASILAIRGSDYDQMINYINYNIPIDSTWHDYEYITTQPTLPTYGTANSLSQSVLPFLLQLRLSSGTFIATDTITLDIDFKDIEIYRCSNNTYHPPITNGHNGAETLMDFTQQGSTNVAEIQKPILSNYRFGLIQSTDRSMGANGSMRANGWEGAMAAASQTAATTINNGVWSVRYNPPSVSNTYVGYIDNYELTAEELAMMGLSAAGVKSNAVQFTSGTASFSGSGSASVSLYYRLQYSTLLGYNSSNASINPTIYNQQYNIHFTGWLKRLTTYPVSNGFLGLSYAVISTMPGIGFSSIVNADNNWHYVDIVFPLNACVHPTSVNNKTFGISCSPTGYTSYINPDTGEAYTEAEATHRPCLALANVKIVVEPAEVYSKDGTNFKLYNLNINQWSEPQYKRIENQTNFKL